MPDYPFAVVIANTKYLESNGDVARAFLRALWKGMDASQKDAPSALKWAAQEDQSFDVNTFERQWEVVGPQMVDETTKSKGYGWHDFKNLQALADFLVEQGLMEKKLDAETFATDAYLQ